MSSYIARAPVPIPTRSVSSWLAAGVVALVGSTFYIRHSLEHGALALPPTYDDVSYLLDGARYLELLDSEGFKAVVEAYLADPPHAPISTGAALIGFSLVGFHNWVGAASNAILLFLFPGLFMRASRALPLFQSICLLATLWLSPFIGTTVWWFRPDMFASLTIALGCAFILTRVCWESDVRARTMGGCLLGAALWAKPTIFPLTLALFAAAVFLASIGSLVKGEVVGVIKAGVTTFGIGIALVLPHYIPSFGTLIEYINNVIFGSGGDIWIHSLPLWDSLTFYLTGYYGRISVGWWLYLAVAVALGCFALFVARRDYSRLAIAARLVAFVVISYIAVTLPTFKGPHGFSFAASLLVATILGCAVILRTVPRPIGSALGLATVAASLAAFNWPFAVAQHQVTFEEARTRHDMVGAIVQTLGEDLESKRVLFSTSTNYTNAYVVEFALRENKVKVPRWVVLHTDADFSAHRAALEASDIVVAYTPDNVDVIGNLPTATPEFRARFISAVEESRLFGPPKTVKSPIDGGSVLIYTRRQRDEK
jgi:hypothetical protein